MAAIGVATAAEGLLIGPTRRPWRQAAFRLTKQARWIGNKLEASKRSQVMFMDRDDILNLFIVSNLPLPKGALPPASAWDMEDDVPF